MNHDKPLRSAFRARSTRVWRSGRKGKTTPDRYPPTLNSLTAGCNQKTSRDPVMSISESEIQATLDGLRSRLLVIESYGASGRVLRQAQLGKVYALPAAGVALVGHLALRGAQTVSELRANSERLYRFDDASSVEAYLDELAQRGSGASVAACQTARFVRAPMVHLLSGEGRPTAAPGSQTAGVHHQLERTPITRARAAELRTELARLSALANGTLKA